MKPVARLPVDLWFITMDNTDAAAMPALASDEDRSRMQQIASPARRRRFAFRRQALRYVLARYLPRFSLDVGPHGKPFVRTHGGRQGLRFSVSSSTAVCAVSVSHAETGVDIEVNPPHVDVAGIVRRFLPHMNPPASWAGQAPALPGEAREMQAFRQHLGVLSWCRLEAYTKLAGSTLHEVLFSGGPVPLLRAEDGHHAVAVTNLHYVCVIAHAQPFRIARVEQIDYARIRREQA